MSLLQSPSSAGLIYMPLLSVRWSPKYISRPVLSCFPVKRQGNPSSELCRRKQWAISPLPHIKQKTGYSCNCLVMLIHMPLSPFSKILLIYPAGASRHCPWFTIKRLHCPSMSTKNSINTSLRVTKRGGIRAHILEDVLATVRKRKKEGRVRRT